VQEPKQPCMYVGYMCMHFVGVSPRNYQGLQEMQWQKVLLEAWSM